MTTSKKPNILTPVPLSGDHPTMHEPIIWKDGQDDWHVQLRVEAGTHDLLIERPCLDYHTGKAWAAQMQGAFSRIATVKIMERELREVAS